mgnify:CR=1 FL=1
MLALVTLAALFGAWRGTRAVLASLARLPRCNDDMVFF